MSVLADIGTSSSAPRRWGYLWVHPFGQNSELGGGHVSELVGHVIDDRLFRLFETVRCLRYFCQRDGVLVFDMGDFSWLVDGGWLASATTGYSSILTP